MEKGSTGDRSGEETAVAAPQHPSDAETAVEAFDRAFKSRLPETIGGYRVVRLIGQGGMGAVYEAEQQQPRRKVALKVIRAGLLTRSMLRRFGFEVEMLGRLQHPGIARIYEAGTAETQAGLQPYFAMEFVEGKPLLKYGGAMERRAKLELLARVADAVHYAHQNGIIHRDLKPDNILVDEHGQPKVLDFGVARSTQADAAATLQTETGAIVGTLAYMSPEQAAGEVHQIDVRSDVYALGVIGYQLLTGKLPYVLPRESLVTALRLIRELDPEPVGKAFKELRGDVETILAKSLEKEKERRYQSAHDLASDIRRHLNDEPITARPADTMYHLTKFVRRNRTLVGGIAATFLVLVAGLVATSWYWRSAVVNRGLAEAHERDTKLKLIDSLIAEGDALALVGRAADAKARHERALAEATQLDESPLPALFGLWEDRRHSPEALAVWQSRTDTRAIAFSPDGKRAVSVGGMMHLWDVGRGTSLRQLSGGQERGGASVAVSADARRIAVGTGMGSVMLWDVETGDIAWTTSIHGAPAAAVAFLPGEKQILSAALDGSIGVVDALTGAVVRRLGAEPAGNPALWKGEGSAAISADLQRIAIGGQQGVVTVFDGQSGAPIHEFRAHDGTVHGMCFTPDGRLVTASSDKTLSIWDMKDGAHLYTLVGHENGVASVAISPDGSQLLSGSWDQTVRLWDMATGRVLRTYTGHSGHMVAPRTVAFAPDMSVALSAASDSIRMWNLRPERQVRSLAPPLPSSADELPRVLAISLAPDGRLIASASGDGRLRLWDVPTGLLLREIDAHDGGANVVSFLPDGLSLLSGGTADGSLKLWSAFPQEEGPAQTSLNVMAVEEERTEALAVSPDGRQAVSGGGNGVMYVWDLESGVQLRSHAGPSPIHGISYSPDGTRVVVAYEDSTLDVIDPAASRSVGRVSQEGGFHNVLTARFGGDGKFIAAGGWSGVPRLWDATSPYRKHAEFTGNRHSSTIFDVIFTADGRFLLSAGWDNTVRIWDAHRRSLIRALSDHQRPVMGLGVSSDGRLAASGSWDGTVKLWELASATDFPRQREAVEEASRTLQRQSGDAAALLVLGNWYAQRGAEPLALRLFDEVSTAGGRISQLQRARCLVALQRWDEARTAYEMAALSSEAPAKYIELCISALPAQKRATAD